MAGRKLIFFANTDSAVDMAACNRHITLRRRNQYPQGYQTYRCWRTNPFGDFRERLASINSRTEKRDKCII